MSSDAVANAVLHHEPTVRLAIFLGVLVVMAAWETIAARRTRVLPRARRWPGNFGIAVLDALLTRLVAPAGAVGFAHLAEARGWGLRHFTDWPVWLEGIAAVVVLDFAIYAQHRVFHAVPFLWRLHRMHHADVDVDVTTGARFHPAEILLSLGVKFLVIAALGASPGSVLVFEVLLNATAMFMVGMDSR